MYQCDIENKKLINRINRIGGQVNALKGRLEGDVEHQDPYEIIRQLTAIKGAVNGMINSYVEHYAKGHLVNEVRAAKDEGSAMAQMDALVEIMRTFSK
jgi:DNA-binding FrmR family transcriptional regulator